MTDLATTPITASNDLSVSAALERGADIAPKMYDPATLLVDKNVRGKARISARFKQSVRQRGVLVPVLAVRTAEGGIRVRMGQRRTLAALEVGRQVPVIVVGDEATDDAATIERILDQFHENDHRDDLSTAENVGVAEQLALYGVPAGEIAHRTQMDRKAVSAALKVAESPLAKAAIAQYEFLTLDQGLVVAEFEDDPETFKALIEAANSGQFMHVAQRARDERDDRAKYAAAQTLLTAAGITVISEETAHSGTVRLLSGLSENAKAREPLSPETHRACPGNAAYLHRIWVPGTDADGPEPAATDDSDTDGEATNNGWSGHGGYQWRPVYVCTDLNAGHHSRSRPQTPPASTKNVKVADLSDAKREKATRTLRETKENNTAWESAKTVREAFLKELAARPRAPKGTTAFLAAAMAHDADAFSDVNGNALAAKLLGVKAVGFGRNRGIAALLTKATEPRAQLIHLLMILAVYEAKSTRDDWRKSSDRTARYLNQLAAIGYQLSPVETRAATTTPGPGSAEQPDTSTPSTSQTPATPDAATPLDDGNPDDARS